jgi:hypothetical protein
MTPTVYEKVKETQIQTIKLKPIDPKKVFYFILYKNKKRL